MSCIFIIHIKIYCDLPIQFEIGKYNKSTGQAYNKTPPSTNDRQIHDKKQNELLKKLWSVFTSCGLPRQPSKDAIKSVL